MSGALAPGSPTAGTPATTGPEATSGERAVPYHCPFCAEEDLRPHESAHGAWHCRSCLRLFSVRFLGLAALPASDPIPFHQGGAR